MNNNNIVVNQVPIDLFELFLNEGGVIELEDEDETYKIAIKSDTAMDYYEKYFLSLVQSEKIDSELINHIPIYVDAESKILLSVKEIDTLVEDNVLGKIMSTILYSDFGYGDEKVLILEIPRTMFIEMIDLDQSLKTNIPAGILSFSVDLMYILVNDERFKKDNFFNLVTDIKNGDIKGIIQEADYEKGGDLKILKLY